MGLVDSHCHLTEEEFLHEQANLLEKARQAGVEHIITCGTDQKSSKRAVDLANDSEMIWGNLKEFEGNYDESFKPPKVWATVGIHPEEVSRTSPSSGLSLSNKIREELLALSNNDKVVGIGESGLDYRVNQVNQEDKARQIELFNIHLQIAIETGLPVVVHNREANEETVSMLKEHKGVRGVMHCFSQDESYLKEVIELGYYVSFAGNMTFKKNEELRMVLKMVPLDKLLFETDSPYLTPEPIRGEWPNTPANVKLVYQRAATELGIETRELEEIVKRNVIKLFTKIK